LPVQIVRTSDELKDALAKLRRNGATVALVPTMGALHAGHMALIEQARQRSDHVIATIFVNPLQFGPNEDLDRYPRKEAADAAMLEQAGCDLLWVPGAEEMYPPGFATKVSVSGLSEQWEGAVRPGHFDGVATVVAKLLAAVRPDIALFGEKDFQQLAVIRQMASDLELGVEIVGVPTVRDPDGLALSSRNAYLTAEERKQAVALPEALFAAVERMRSGQAVQRALDEAQERLRAAGFSRIDYVALVDEQTLEPTEKLCGALRLIAAAVIGGTRLIDNIPVQFDTSQ
jgi:pantoate--beta-alanine ligase